MRFDLVEPLELEGEELPAGTHIWYRSDGHIQEVLRPDE